MIVFTYSGQGSQKPGMGELWQKHPSWELVLEASEIANRDLSHLLLQADEQELKETHNSQLSTFLISMVILDAIQRLGLEAAGHVGHSLGEYSALTAAGALDFGGGVRLVQERGEAMQEAAFIREGTMAAILGLDDSKVDDICRNFTDEVWIANFNAPGQVVIAGDPKAVDSVGIKSKEAGAKKVTSLEVSGAFHTPFMLPARDRLQAAIEAADVRRPDGTVVANVDGLEHDDPEAWRNLMNAQLIKPVRWHQSLTRLSELGFTTFVEVGPGNILTALAKRTLRSSKRYTVNTPDDLDHLLTVFAQSSTIPSSTRHEGEHLFATERLVVSPSAGIFSSTNAILPGDSIIVGQLLGSIGTTEVRSPFSGILMGWLAVDTERVTSSQPIAWLQVE